LAVDIYIEGERLDLFKDENISVTSAVQDVQDISKLNADFSQSFTVPASANNNRIFKNYYNADITGGFDARTRKVGTIDIDTLDFKRGKISLLEVKMQENEPAYYKINFFGDTIKLKDLIGDDKIKDLIWLDNFTHDYSSANVKTGLTTGLDFTVGGVVYTKAICYPLVSYARQYLYDSDVTDTTSTDKLVNIAYDGGRVDGVAFGELRPAIKLSVIIQAITEKYGITFTGDFFNTQNFTDLYVNVNNTKDSLSNGLLIYESLAGTEASVGGLETYKYETTVTPAGGYTTTPYKIRLTINDQIVHESSSWLTGTQAKIGSRIGFTEDYTVKAEVITETDFDFSATTKLTYYHGALGNIPTVVFSNSYTSQSIDLQTIITSLFKDVKVYDFLGSIFKMFNLVAVPDGTALYVNDLQTWYSEGAIYDITPYVDTETVNVRKGKILSQINFKFKQSKQILANFFKENNSATYGSIEQKLFDTFGDLLDGGKLDVPVIFEQPIFERLNDVDTAAETSIQYSLMLDENLNSFVSEPFLMYLPTVNVTANPIGFKGTTYDQLNGNVIMPSHSLEIDLDSFNINFNAEINEYTSQVFLDTIYKIYYDDYVSDIFSVQRRIFDFKAKLPTFLLNKLKNNDRLVINDRRYIINSMTNELTNRNDKLELINDIYDAPLASDSLNSSLWTPTSKTISAGSTSSDSRYVGLATATLSKVDTGDGVTWLTITGSVTGVINTITFDLLTNETGVQRTVQIKATDGVNDPKFTIIQTASGIKFDNDNITFDNDNITFDNS
jgi:hypothetical protein